MELTIFQIDAFAEMRFEGNPAAVIPLQSWLSDELLQKIAAENNLSETAYFVKEGEHHHIRWFTPTAEVALCGHATLAAAYVLFNQLGYQSDELTFSSLSGSLQVTRSGSWLELNFPRSVIEPCEPPAGMAEALGRAPEQVWCCEDYIAIYANQSDITSLSPDFRALAKLDRRGVVVTAPGYACDFVSRCFAPKYGIDEDPVTGSAHCSLVPYWAQQLGKDELLATQLSERGGRLRCRLEGDRVHIAGKAVKYLEGRIEV